MTSEALRPKRTGHLTEKNLDVPFERGNVRGWGQTLKKARSR